MSCSKVLPCERVAPLEMYKNTRPSTSADSEPAFVALAKADIPGAALDEPLDVHNVADLPWWLQCHGIKLVHVLSRKKQQLISMLSPLV